MAARIRWIQWDELVLGENHPNTAYPDNDNRPLKDICLFSNTNPQASDFPGFIACYQGVGNPNGVQVGNIRNGFWSVDDGSLWMKQTGDNTSTGWVLIGGADHLSGDGSPEGVASTEGDSTPAGKYYDQQDSASLNPTWVKRELPIVTPLSADWFKNPTGDIATRVPDGGASITPFPLRTGVWTIHPEFTGIWSVALLSSGRNGLTNVTAAPDAAVYFMADVVYTGNDQAAGITVQYSGNSATSGDAIVGVGIRWSETLASGYLLTFDLGDTFKLWKVVTGVLTQIGATVQVGEVAIFNTVNSTVKADAAFEIRAVENVVQAWVNGLKVIEVIDETYPDSGVPVVYGIGDFATEEYCIRAFTTGDVAFSDPTKGWFSQNGFERDRNVAMGTDAIAFSNAEQYNMDPLEEFDPYGVTPGFDVAGPNVAIGYKASAMLPKLTGDNTGSRLQYSGAVAVGGRASAFGAGSIAVGHWAVSRGESVITIGAIANGNGTGIIAIGEQAYSEGLYNITLGYRAGSYGDSTIVIGKFAGTDVNVESGIAIGKDSFIEQNTVDCIAIGTGTYITEPAQDSVALGNTAYIGGFTGCTAIGASATVDGGDYSTGLGWGATTNGAYGLALGYLAFAPNDNQWVFGADNADGFMSELLFNGGPGAAVRGPNIVCGTGSLANAATDGFLYIPSMAGAPVGVPTAYAGMVPIAFDRTANKIYIYDGAWLATAALT